MDDDVVIKASGVSKKFSRNLKSLMKYGFYDIGRSTLGMSIDSSKLRKDEFWAVDDVSFELRRGETLGIIGLNGSGKSTMLKMLNGIFMPDKGSIEIKGKVGALIEVGAGFHPLLTGRENIYVNGAILGMSKKEIDEKFDDIVAFADIGDFLDSPVKNYSSGMYVRLGFAVAIHCEPDILIVDEILAVGDRNFQIKCFRKLHELKKKNDVSIVLVSHNEYTMREYTQRCIVLDKGKMVFNGESEDAISFYINKSIKDKEIFGKISGSIFESGIIKKITLMDNNGNEVDKIQTGNKLIIDFDYEIQQKIKKPIFGINFYNSDGLLTGFWNSYENIELPNIHGRGKIRVTVDPFDVPIDNYRCSVVVCEGEESNVLEWKDLEQKLIVERQNNTRGSLKLRQNWKVIL